MTQIASDVPTQHGVSEVHLNLGKLTPPPPPPLLSKSSNENNGSGREILNDSGESLSSSKTRGRPTRSKSLTDLDDIHDKKDNNNNINNSRNKKKVFDQLFPFTNDEVELYWLKQVNALNLPSIIPFEQQQRLESLLNQKLQLFKNTLSTNVNSYEQLLGETNSVLVQLDDLINKYSKISKETLDFERLLSGYLNTKIKFDTKHHEIAGYLKHFETLDPITRHLSKAGSSKSLVRLKRFKEILVELDESLAFIKENPEMKDHDFYNMKFRQCMTRALSLVKDYLTYLLKQLLEGINIQLKAKKIAIELVYVNEYVNFIEKFDFQSLIKEISTRIGTHDEYLGLLNEVLNCYFDGRLLLVSLYVDAKNTITNDKNDIVQFTQHQINFYKQIIQKEYSLFYRFFPTNDDQLALRLQDYLKRILESLHDKVRPYLLRETNITKLCALDTLLQKYYEFEEADSSTVVSLNVSDGLLSYGILFQPILNDCQTRLIFRIQNYVDNKLMKYNPSTRDIRLLAADNQTLVTRRKSSVNESTTTTVSLDVDYEDNIFPDVYMPLAKALTLLSNIYDLINSVVFDDLAHYIVHGCIYLLKNNLYKKCEGTLGTTDANLILVKNILILRSHISNFDIQFTRNDYSIDFTTGLHDVYQTLRSGDFNLNNNGIIELVKRSVPRIVDNMIDANYEIEFELRNAVNELIQGASNSICEPLIQGKDNSAPMEVYTQLKLKLDEELPRLQTQINLFIDEEAASQFLIHNVANLIFVNYEKFYQEKLLTAGTEGTEVMDPDTFYGYLASSITVESEEAPHFNEDILNEVH